MTNQKGFERKHFFIDRHLQGRYMLTFLVPMLVMLAFMLLTLYLASQSIVISTTRIIRDEMDAKTTLRFQDNTQPTVAAYETLFDDMRSYLRDFSSDSKFRQALMSTLLWVFGIGLFLVIAQITMLTIYFSHKLAGPIFRFERICHSVIDGDYTVSVHLRKGDEMQNLARLINEMVTISRDRIKTGISETDEGRNSLSSKLKL